MNNDKASLNYCRLFFGDAVQYQHTRKETIMIMGIWKYRLPDNVISLVANILINLLTDD